MQKTGITAIELLKHFESLHDGDLSQVGLQPKLDPIGIWTEGYGRAMIDPATRGHLRGAKNKALAYKLQTINTEAEAVAALANDLVVYENAVRMMLKPEVLVKLTSDQFGALVSFAYNCGTKYKSTTGAKPYALWTNVTAWANGKMTMDALVAYWNSSVNKGGGRVLAGLVRRRKSEANLFATGKLKTNW